MALSDIGIQRTLSALVAVGLKDCGMELPLFLRSSSLAHQTSYSKQALFNRDLVNARA